MLKYFRFLLLPFNPLYAIVIYLRNKCYDWGIFKSTEFKTPIICIGNLAVGGAGKTPTTEYLVHLLRNYKVAILSRGYGRSTTGFVLADHTATAETIGDEPMQYFRKFKNVTVAVCEDRVTGIHKLKANHDVILLDDAYQHRKLKAGFNLLLFEFSKIMKFQMLLPAGNLREPFSGVKRAKEILITKAPITVGNETRDLISQKLNCSSEQQITYSHLKYGDLIHLYSGDNIALEPSQEVYLLTGIANPAPLRNHLKDQQLKVHIFEYPDHHRFSTQEIKALIKAFEDNPSKEKIIVTTEKDGQRLLSDKFRVLLLNLPIYYLPIRIELNSADKDRFDLKILNYVESTRRIDKIH